MSNFRLRSDITSKESTLQLVYDVLRLTSFYKAFLFTSDVPEIYMQEFWATDMVHHHSIRFKMENKKRIVNLEYFREMLHICPRLPSQTFDEHPFKEEILAFFRFLRHSGDIRRLTDVNINKLHQLWTSFAAIINKCLSGKSTGYDSLRLSQAQILWGLYHKKNVDFAYLLWEEFVYQVEHKDAKKEQRDVLSQMFTAIKLVSRHQNTQQFGVMLPIEIANEEIKNSKAYKEYYAVASGATPPKTKASIRKTKSSFDTSITPPTIAGTRLSTYAKGKQPAKASKPKSLVVLYEVAMTEAEQLKLATKRSLQQTHISQASGSGTDEGTDDDDEGNDDQDEGNDDDQDKGDNDDDQDEGNDDDQDSDEEGEEFIHPKLSIHDKEETKDEECFDPIAKTPEHSNDESNDNEHLDVHTTQEFEDPHVTLTPVNPDGQQKSSSMDVQAPTTVASLTLSAPTLTPSTIATISTVPQAPPPPTTAPSTLLQDIPNFGSLFGFNRRLKTLEANFSEFMQTNQFAGAISSILGIVQRYMNQRMNKAVKVAIQIQSDRLRDEAQAKNEEFLQNLDENIQNIIKDQVKEKVKVQVSKILLEIEKTVNEQLEAEVLTRSFNSSKTSYVVAADLSKMELKKILIEKMEGNKSIHQFDEQRNLYKALVEAYKSDKIILDTYGDVVTLKRRRDDDADKDKEISAGSDRGPRGEEKERSQKEPLQTTQDLEESSHQEFVTGATDDQPLEEASQHPEWFQQQKKPPTPDRDWNKTLPATHGSIHPWISKLLKQADFRSSFNELMDTPVDFSTFLMNRHKVDTLTLELLVGPTYELMNGSCKSRNVISFDHFINNDLECLRGGASSHKYTTSVTKTKEADYGHIKKFKESDFKRLRIQDIEDMLLLLVQGKLTNLMFEERFAFNVSLRMFTKSIIIQRRVEDLQLGVESYQKKLNLTRPDTYRSDLNRKEAYTAYSNPRGFIYHNKDKQNRLMQIDELHKFSDGTLNDVRTALDDRLKGI
nr:hypothetical protein [Tanacetum cinerariifolium]